MNSVQLAPTSANPGVTLAWWLYHEAVRREELKVDEFCGSYVLSYPRSGNHATRFVLEFLSGQPTLGQMTTNHSSARRDYTICRFSSGPNMFRSRLRCPPVAIKRHRLRPNDSVGKLVLIERDPVEAVLSHTNRADQASEKDLEAGVAWWKSLQDSFENHPTGQRHLVRFEDIVDKGTGWIRDLT